MKISVALVVLAVVSRGALATFDGLPPMSELGNGELVAGLQSLFGDVADELRSYFDGVNMTEIKSEWEKYQTPSQRRLSAVTIQDGDSTRSFDGMKAFVEDAFSSVVDLTQDGLDQLAILKTNFEIPTKGEAIQNIMGNIPDFGDWASESHSAAMLLMQDLKEADTFDEAAEVLETAADEYCTPEEYNPPEKEPTNCEGPRVRLEFVPKKCVVVNHEVECEPAKLVLAKKAGRCTMKHYKPATYTGKVCKFEKNWGKDEKDLYGGDTYTAGHISDAVREATQ